MFDPLTHTYDGYSKMLPCHITDPIYEDVRRDVKKMFCVEPINPLHINDSIKMLSPRMKSPGMPYVKRGLSINQIDTSLIKLDICNIKYGKTNKFRHVCLIDLCAPPKEGKIPLIFPAAIVFSEGMFTIPLVEEISIKCGAWTSFGPTGNISALSLKRQGNQKWLYVCWHGIEYNTPTWMIRQAFHILRGNLDFSKYQKFGEPANEKLLPTLWNKLMHYFVNTPVKMRDGIIRVKHQGVPADSLFAKLILTICNVIACKYVLRKLMIEVVPDAEWYSEERAIILFNSHVDFGIFVQCIKMYFGFEVDLLVSGIKDSIIC